MSPDVSITVRFHPPPEDLRRYFTTFYVTEIDVPDGQLVEDALQPEWAGLRFFSGASPDAWVGQGAVVSGATFIATGPSSLPCHFRLGTTRFWGIGLLPLGWHRYVGKPACDHANLVTDGARHPAFAAFTPLADRLFGTAPDEAAELARIISFFRGLGEPDPNEEARIVAVHGALIDPRIDSVAKLVEEVGTGQRTIERLCQRHFGFSPKLLLRRQRFMRSLAQFMLDPSLKWIGAIDGHYHDQAQFVRDFHQFMDMTPREYAALPHPVLDRFMHERARMLRAAVQTLDSPDGAAPDRT
ncbi:helix-turn-helix domain-containing protein [Novosphingobium aquiterrae]|uniref:Helix-turn-helix domain-containing protein n=1 Tax=Novosphingobium aquiterrae TaxID=624388 RepID=A0ABV6PKG5_9SPHN